MGKAYFVRVIVEVFIVGLILIFFIININYIKLFWCLVIMFDYSVKWGG